MSQSGKSKDKKVSFDGIHALARGVKGQPYSQKHREGNGVWGDCSSSVSVLANYTQTPENPWGERAYTGNLGEFLSARGFEQGHGGSGALTISWYRNNGKGHTVARLPNGDDFEMTPNVGLYNNVNNKVEKYSKAMHLPASSFNKNASGSDAQGSETVSMTAGQNTSSALQSLLSQNPGVKVNQDLINLFYKMGGGTWDGASAQASKYGVSLGALCKDRGGLVQGAPAQAEQPKPQQEATKPKQETAKQETPTGPTSVSGNGVVNGGYPNSGEANIPVIFNYLTANVFTGMPCAKALACGFLGNIYQESHYQPDAEQCPGKANSGGKGIVQWDDRKYNLYKHCGGDYASKKWVNLNLQLSFIKAELESTEKNAYNIMVQGTTANTAAGARTAAEIICKKFERPGKPALETRMSKAAELFGALGGADSTPQQKTSEQTSQDGKQNTNPAQNETPKASGEQSYVVKKGDTLSKIANQFNVSGGYQALASFNGIKNPNVINVGQVIRIPGGTQTAQTAKTEQKQETQTQNTQAAKQTKVVVDGHLNIRSEPNTNCSIVGKLYNGDAITYTSDKNGWLKITSPKGGYVYKQYTELVQGVQQNVVSGTKGAGGLTYMTNAQAAKADPGRNIRKIVDLATKKSFNISWEACATYHSDCTPATQADTDVMKAILNPGMDPKAAYWKNTSSWSWNGREGAVQLKNGTWISCGFHLRPHAAIMGGNPGYPLSSQSNTRPSGGWPLGGHFCVYYDKNTPGGTQGCKDAAERAKNMSL